MSHDHSSAADSSNDQGKTLRERMSQDLQLRGMAKRTQEGYLREVRKLACYYNTPPDRLSESQVADYLLYLINDCEFAPGSLRVAYSGLKFFYTYTEPRDWDVLKKLRIPKQKTLPDVLSMGEVRQLMAAVRQPDTLFDDMGGMAADRRGLPPGIAPLSLRTGADDESGEEERPDDLSSSDSRPRKPR